MSSAQEHRQLIIQENIPKLVKALTGFNETDENFGLCETYAFGRIACHRYLSVNSHEIRRRIDGLAERFMADNYTRYGEYLKQLVQALVTDPACSDHYEYDIQWSILHFLLELSHNPVTALAKNMANIELLAADDSMNVECGPTPEQRAKDVLMNDLISSLIRQNIQIEEDEDKHNVGHCVDDSDLSDWSEENDEDDHATDIVIPAFIDTISSTAVAFSESSSLCGLKLNQKAQHLRPPQKPLPYIEFEASTAPAWLKEHIQQPWWLNDYHSQVTVISDFPAANTCQLFRERLSALSGGLMNMESVTTLSEWCLMREIIWMLQIEPPTTLVPPQTIDKCSRFFSINNETAKITVNANVSLASCTVDGMRTLLEDFATNMTILYRFRLFFREVFQHDSTNIAPPHSLQCYANGLKNFLEIISNSIVEKEAELIAQDPMETRTIVWLYNEYAPHFRMLHQLYDIHTDCYVDFKANAAHVCVERLLSGLLNKMDTAPSVDRLSLVTSLFLVSIRFYLFLFNNWWFEGCFNDWRNEFLIYETCSSDQPTRNPTVNKYQLRIISPSVTDTPNANRIKQCISDCELIRLLGDHSIEAGYILDILYNLDKLTDMKEELELREQTEDLYESFLNQISLELKKFDKKLVKMENDDEEEEKEGDGEAENEEEENLQTDVIKLLQDTQIFESNEHSAEANSMAPVTKISGNMNFDLFCEEVLGETNPLLCMVFEQSVEIAGKLNEDGSVKEKIINIHQSNTCYNIYRRFNEITDFPMPINTIVFNVLHSLLESRISIANKYVLKIFKDEYKVLDHIFNLQRVFLFGAGDLMLTFYSNLFKSMNAGENWNNPYLLTVQLDNVLTTKYPDLHSLFSVQIKASDCHVKEALDAINDITINYVVRDSIRDIIHSKSLAKYNAVFCFLLQIKWAIWTLETLRFPVAFKKRKPYQPLTMVELIFRRLALLRNWIIYSIQCVHSHLMTFVIQSMGQQFARKMEKVECLREIIELHDSYIETIYAHCFRKKSDSQVRIGIEQLLNLAVVLNDEWNSLASLETHADNVDGDGSVVCDGDKRQSVFNIHNASTQIANVEATYINCHCYIAEALSKDVYTRDRTELASLSAAFNCSCPY